MRDDDANVSSIIGKESVPKIIMNNIINLNCNLCIFFLSLSQAVLVLWELSKMDVTGKLPRALRRFCMHCLISCGAMPVARIRISAVTRKTSLHNRERKCAENCNK